MKKFFSSDHPYSELLELAVNALKYVRPRVLRSVSRGTGLGHPTYNAPDGTPKQMLNIDQSAENDCADFLLNHLGGEGNVRVLGEETLWKFKTLDLSTQRLEGYGERTRLVNEPETRLTVITDMIDGSDLVERGLQNWCSAMIFFKPSQHPKILFSMVHNADDVIYGADETTTFVIPHKAKRGESFKRLAGPEVRKLRTDDSEKMLLPEETGQVSVFFYGQKHSHFTTIPPGFLRWITNSPAVKRLRIYDLAGNPMMVRLANGENIHAVFEHIGQFPHDAAPGAYIGLRAGVPLVDLEGHEIKVSNLAERLMKPSGAGLTYVMACTEELALQLAAALSQPKQRFYMCSDPSCTGQRVAEGSDTPPRCDCGKEMRFHDRRGAATFAGRMGS